MAKQRVHRKVERSEAEKARLKGLRDSFQKDRPTREDLVQGGDYVEPMPLGDLLEAKAIAKALKEARQRANLSLSQAAEATGMDRSAISRLENGVYQNTTVNTINRLAHACGMRVTFRLEPQPDLTH